MKNLIIIILLLLGLCIIFNSRCSNTTQVITTTDTVVIRDTIIVIEPKPTKIEIKEIIRDTVVTTLKDTVEVMLPLETVTYADSNYFLKISGYKPKLDTFKLFPTVTTITKEKLRKTQEKGFKIKPSIGYGFGLGTRKLDVWVGVSLVYNF